MQKIELLDNDQQARPAGGLTRAEVAARLETVGFNEPLRTRRAGAVRQILGLFMQPLIAILLVAALISGTMGNFVSAAIIVMMVTLSAGLNFIQTRRSERAAEALRGRISLTAAALRDGEWHEVAFREIVPGDTIRLTAGDVVPADARLLESKDLHVQEAALTGESLPAEKNAESPIVEQTLVFQGTSVINGAATAIVTATGEKTAFGAIARRLTEKPPETEFERGNRQFGYLIARVVLFLVLFVFFVNTLLDRDPLESLLFSIALAVGLTPEFLPMITTVTLGQGALRMARRKTIVRHLAAIQNFGSMDILCADKTGTLTRGELVLEEHPDAFGDRSDKTLRLGYLNSFFETGVYNALDQAVRTKANPMDEAILRSGPVETGRYRKIDEMPLDFERRRMSVVVERAGERTLICKGAPESVLEACDRFERRGRVSVLNAAARRRCERVFEGFSRRGARVLAVAYRTVEEREEYRADDERDLILTGFLAFADAPLESAAVTLKKLGEDGVEVKILTGDNEQVSRYVCEQVGFRCGRIVLGREIESMTDAALGQVAERTSVFARVSPIQKNRILLALKQRGHVVGFLGDGVNDAPSLRSADVGISVANATDVAKEAAEVILLERSLDVLHTGIIEGRKSFGNVMKYILMGTSSNFGNMFSMAAAALFLPFLPMLPMQIILNNFLYDAAQVTLAADNVDSTFIHKPHRWDLNLIRNFMLCLGPISSIYDFLTFYVLLKLFRADESFFHTGWFVESLATQTLVVFLIRTAKNSLASPPSRALVLTVFAVLAIAVYLPFSALAGPLGFVPLPFEFFLFLLLIVGSYLLVVELVKRRLMKSLVR